MTDDEIIRVLEANGVRFLRIGARPDGPTFDDPLNQRGL